MAAPEPGGDLREAQTRKIERLLDRTEVGPGTRVLEIGTGWGELAIRAAPRGATVALDHPLDRAEGAGRAPHRRGRARPTGSPSSCSTTASWSRPARRTSAPTTRCCRWR